MAMTTDSSPIESAVLAQAAEWYAALRGEDVTVADLERWQAWLTANPEHQRAWARVERIEQRFYQLPAEPARAALQAAGKSRRQMLKMLTVLAVGGPTLWAAWRLAPVQEWQADYRTAVGEIREITLTDGTRVWLNTATALNVRYDQIQRHLELISGEVMIDTAPDTHPSPRPLILQTNAGMARPLGTRFSAHDRDGTVVVSVFSGAVALHPATEATAGRIMEAGQRTRFTPTVVERPRPLSSDSPSWTRGVLIADGMRLGDFLKELGRYRHGYLGYATEVANLRLIGAYPLNDTDRVLAALEDSLPVRVRRLTRWWVRVEVR